MENSKIEWTDHTFNPWIGCTKVSPGCLNCYAEALNLRWKKGENWGPGAPRARTSASYWRDPLKWNSAIAIARRTWDAYAVKMGREANAREKFGDRPRNARVFSASLADWLDHEVPIDLLADFLFLVYSTRHLDWLLLTKRPRAWRVRIEAVLFTPTSRHTPEFWAWVRAWLDGTPPDNVWIGTTAEDQDRYTERVEWLGRIPARIHFLSCEPLLGPINLGLFNSLVNWVIVGGESGSGARPMHGDWARRLHTQCSLGGIAFFFKQWGEHDAAGHKVGKHAAGKELFGRIIQEFPV